MPLSHLLTRRFKLPYSVFLLPQLFHQRVALPHKSFPFVPVFQPRFYRCEPNAFVAPPVSLGAEANAGCVGLGEIGEEDERHECEVDKGDRAFIGCYGVVG